LETPDFQSAELKEPEAEATLVTTWKFYGSFTF